jgi:hypothetical protein
MSQLHGKQIRNLSTSLGKLSGTGIVAFDAATMSFSTNSVLTRISPTTWTGEDIVNKSYVDSVVQGLDIKESVRVKSNTVLTLSGTQSVDGVSLEVDNRILVNGQNGLTASADNGIWVVKSGAWIRPDDFKSGNASDGTPIVTPGAFTFVEEGTFADSGFVLVTDGEIIVDTTAIKFVQFSSAGIIQAGDGLTKTGNELDVVVDTSGLTISNNLVALNDTITGERIFSDGLIVNDGLSVTDGATVSGGIDVTGGATINTLDVTDGLDVTGGATIDTLDVTNGLDVTGGATVSGGLIVDEITTDEITAGTGSFTTLTVSATPSNPDDVVNLSYFGASYSQLQDQLDDISDDFITAIEVGPGLTISSATEGTASIAILDTTAGIGLTFTSGVYAVNLGVNSGLTFSGDNIIVDPTIAGNGLDFTTGVLTVNTSEVTTALAGNGLTANGGELDVNVNSDSLEIDDDVIRLKDTITGQRTFSNGIIVNQGATVSGQLVANNGVSVASGGLTVSNNTNIGGNLEVLGDFTVSGTFSYINTTELLVEDNYITLNSGLTSGTAISGGIEVLRGDSTAASLLWNESINYWQIGLSGSESTIITEAGTGLTKSNNTLSIDTTGFATTLAGNGLTANGGALDINFDSSGLNITNDILALNDTITGGRTFSGFLVADGGLDVNSGLTVSGSTLLENNLTVTGTSSFSGLLTADGITASSGFFTTSLQTPNAPTDGDDVINLTYFGASYSQLEDLIDNITNDAITGITAGDGLSGGGTAGFVTLDVNTGLGLEISGDDVAMVWGGTATGLTFSNNAVSANVDGNTIVINSNGELAVSIDGFKAEPVYQTFTGITVSQDGTIGTLGATPSIYSRIEAYVNGLKVVAKGNVAGLTTSVSGASVEIIGNEVTWVSSSYNIEGTDVIEIVYEAN